MKLSENWLREWVNPPATATELAHKLNMAGLEAEAEAMLAVLPQGIVVGKIAVGAAAFLSSSIATRLSAG